MSKERNFNLESFSKAPEKKDKEDEIKGAWLTNASPDGYKSDEIYRKLLIPLCIGRKKIWLKILISYFNHS